MTGERKQKTAKASKAVKGRRGKATARATRHSNRFVAEFRSGLNPHLYLARVVKVSGSHVDVVDKDGDTKKVRISGKLALPGGLHHKLNVQAMRPDSFVLVDGGDIVSMLDSSEARSAKKRAGWPTGSANSLFNRSRSGSRSRSQ
jgi:hypothetical protein